MVNPTTPHRDEYVEYLLRDGIPIRTLVSDLREDDVFIMRMDGIVHWEVWKRYDNSHFEIVPAGKDKPEDIRLVYLGNIKALPVLRVSGTDYANLSLVKAERERAQQKVQIIGRLI